jgi:hypothetical protein
LSLVIDAYAIACADVIVAGDRFPSWFWLPHSAIVLISMVLIIYTIVDIARRREISAERRTAWFAGVLLVSAIAVPTYFLRTRIPAGK